jgi:hypothetical protein
MERGVHVDGVGVLPKHLTRMLVNIVARWKLRGYENQMEVDCDGLPLDLSSLALPLRTFKFTPILPIRAYSVESPMTTPLEEYRGGTFACPHQITCFQPPWYFQRMNR